MSKIKDLRSSDEGLTNIEPVAHMFPSDLERFKTAETFAQAYSLKVGSPGEVTVPLYTAEQMREYKRAALGFASVLRGLSERLPDDRGDPSVGIGPTWIMGEDEWYALRALLAGVAEQERREQADAGQ